MDLEIKKLMKLKVTEQNLAALLQKIDTEINQTDVQWMHLKSLVPIPITQNVPQAELSKLKPIVQTAQLLKVECHVDDQSINETQLDLSLGNWNTKGGNISEEESD